MIVYPLYSSSKGNMFCLESAYSTILIDLGVTYKNILLALDGIGKSVNDVKAVLITHEHIDHIKGLPQFCKNNPNVDVYCTIKTKTYIENMLNMQNISANIIGLEYNDKFNIDNIHITVLETSHDAIMPCAYNLKDSSTSITFATDLGYVSESLQNYFNESNLNILESNFDKIMLEYGKYPSSVKNRIRGTMGHLSNEDAACVITKTLKNNPCATFILSHLSDNNNDENLAKDTIFNYLKDNNIDNYNISFASKDISFERYIV